MLTKDGTRDLLPPISGDPEDILGPEMPFAGSLVATSDIPPISYPPASRADADLPPGGQEDGAHHYGFEGGPVNMPLGGQEPAAAASHHSVTLVRDPEGGHFAPISVVSPAAKPPEIDGRRGDADGPHQVQGQAPEADGNDGRGVDPEGFDPASVSESVGADSARSVDVRQIAIVDQEASILVNGYRGEVVARLHVDQDLLIDQEMDVDVTVDGDGQFNLLLDQDLRIDQDVQIDLEIFDVDGVLYVDLLLHDIVKVEQDTTVDMRISEGPPGGTVEVDQDIEIMQDVDVDIDIEDDLEERYIIKVGVEVLQRADVDQDVVVDVKGWNGEIDVDIDAAQTATVDQVTIIQTDFALV